MPYQIFTRSKRKYRIFGEHMFAYNSRTARLEWGRGQFSITHRSNGEKYTPMSICCTHQTICHFSNSKMRLSSLHVPGKCVIPKCLVAPAIWLCFSSQICFYYRLWHICHSVCHLHTGYIELERANTREAPQNMALQRPMIQTRGKESAWDWTRKKKTKKPTEVCRAKWCTYNNKWLSPSCQRFVCLCGNPFLASARIPLYRCYLIAPLQYFLHATLNWWLQAIKRIIWVLPKSERLFASNCHINIYRFQSLRR